MAALFCCWDEFWRMSAGVHWCASMTQRVRIPLRSRRRDRKPLATSCRQFSIRLRRMQEELQWQSGGPGSNPGRAFAGTVAQMAEHQTPFAEVVSPLLVAAGSKFSSGTIGAMDTASGLCASCQHASTITSDRGSRFVFCGLSRTDAQFPKYPRLPVVSCSGWRPAEPS